MHQIQQFLEFFVIEANGLVVIVGTRDVKIQALTHDPSYFFRFRRFARLAALGRVLPIYSKRIAPAHFSARAMANTSEKERESFRQQSGALEWNCHEKGPVQAVP
jgi:hypothetical protein